MKKTCSTILFCSFMLQLFGQSDKDYQKLINYSFDSTVTYVKGIPGYLFLKNAKGRYILQAYNYSTGRVYKHLTFKNEAMEVMHGTMVWLDDQGNLYEKGLYVNGLRAGVWRMPSFRGGYSEGPYVNNRKEGPWSTFDTLGIKTREDFYERDTIKKVVFFNPDGTEKDTTITEQEDAYPHVMPAFICDKYYKKFGEMCAEKSMLNYLTENLIYPKNAREIGIQGDALYSFVIDRDGSVINVHTINGICDEIEKEGKRIILKMPKWAPGSVGGEPVKVKFTLPIGFRLE